MRQRQQKTLNDQPLPPSEMKFIRLDGISVDVEVASIAFDFRNHQEVQVIARDITERKRRDARNSCRRKKWRRSASSPAASRTISTTSCPRLSAIPNIAQLVLKENPEVRGHPRARC